MKVVIYMPKKLGIFLLVLSLIIATILFSNFYAIRRVFKNYKSSSKGLNRVATIYSYNGDILGTYESPDMYVKVGKDNSIEIQMKGKKYIFANVGIIIEEK